MPVDNFPGHSIGAAGPYSRAVAVTPSDEDDLDFVTCALYVGAAGEVTVTMADGTDVQFLAVPAGTTIPIRVIAVKDTGTDATSIVALG